MPLLDRTARKAIRDLGSEAKRLKHHGTLNVWKHYQVVSTQKWLEIDKKQNLRITLKYIPDDVCWTELYPKTDNDKVMIDKWYSDYHQYLTEKKNPAYGKIKCEKCILNPVQNGFLNKVMAKSCGAEYPCNVLNFFQCPYKEDDKSYLFYLEQISEFISNVLQHNHNILYGYKSTILVDFVLKKCLGFLDYHESLSWNYSSSLDKFEFSEMTDVPIWTDDDLQLVLTNEDLFVKIIDEYIEHEKRNLNKIPDDELAEKITRLERLKPVTLKCLAQIKGMIKVGNPKNSTCQNTKQIMPENPEETARIMKRVEHQPELASRITKPKNGICVYCDKFSHVLCTNCDMWICSRHVQKHGIEKHNTYASNN